MWKTPKTENGLNSVNYLFKYIILWNCLDFLFYFKQPWWNIAHKYIYTSRDLVHKFGFMLSIISFSHNPNNPGIVPAIYDTSWTLILWRNMKSTVFYLFYFMAESSVPLESPCAASQGWCTRGVPPTATPLRLTSLSTDANSSLSSSYQVLFRH